jgi:hypothetical protein
MPECSNIYYISGIWKRLDIFKLYFYQLRLRLAVSLRALGQFVVLRHRKVAVVYSALFYAKGLGADVAGYFAG